MVNFPSSIHVSLPGLSCEIIEALISYLGWLPVLDVFIAQGRRRGSLVSALSQTISFKSPLVLRTSRSSITVSYLFPPALSFMGGLLPRQQRVGRSLIVSTGEDACGAWSSIVSLLYWLLLYLHAMHSLCCLQLVSP